MLCAVTACVTFAVFGGVVLGWWQRGQIDKLREERRRRVGLPE